MIRIPLHLFILFLILIMYPNHNKNILENLWGGAKILKVHGGGEVFFDILLPKCAKSFHVFEGAMKIF